jgi:hypothetical protein
MAGWLPVVTHLTRQLADVLCRPACDARLMLERIYTLTEQIAAGVIDLSP